MATTKVRTYLSSTLVLLAFDWPDGPDHQDFLGFAIKRRPGFGNETEGWLPNRIGFNGPDPAHKGYQSQVAPIQKFMWWDAAIDTDSTQKEFHYTIYPVIGTAAAPRLVEADSNTVVVRVPAHEQAGIGTWFNRAVVSSQSFEALKLKVGLHDGAPTAEQALTLRTWLANGLEKAVPDFLKLDGAILGGIYHLSDSLWVLPALEKRAAGAEIVYDSRDVSVKENGVNVKKPSPNTAVVQDLKGKNAKLTFFGRNKTKIMHNKILVGYEGNHPKKVLCGSANFTTEGLTSQANLLHTIDSSELAQYYAERLKLLKDNPTTAKTAEGADWSYTVSVGGAAVRAFFSPEPGQERQSIETIVQAVYGARSSVVFCLFMPTDQRLRQACFDLGDAGKTMFGLVNNISTPKGDAEESEDAGVLANVELFHRSQKNRDVVDHEWFGGEKVPTSFFGEHELFPGEKRPPYPPVVIHHKFILIDGETDTPTVYTGSANMSKSSTNGNDENLLEIKGSRDLAACYLAEFLRLYEHYRARAAWKSYVSKNYDGYELAPDSSWAKKHFQEGTPEWKNRISMTTGLS